MSHQEKQRIFDEYARSQEIETFNEWLEDYGIHGIVKKDLMNFVFAACDLVQEEQQKRIAENARIDENMSDENIDHWIDKTSITNPENIIK